MGLRCETRGCSDCLSLLDDLRNWVASEECRDLAEVVQTVCSLFRHMTFAAHQSCFIPLWKPPSSAQHCHCGRTRSRGQGQSGP